MFETNAVSCFVCVFAETKSGQFVSSWIRDNKKILELFVGTTGFITISRYFIKCTL